MRFLKRMARALVAFVLLGSGIWAAGALYFRLPADENLRVTAAVLIGLAGLLAAIGALRGRWRAIPVYLLALIVLGAWWSTIRPSNLRDWEPFVARQPAMEIVNDQLIVRNLRNFAWRTETDYTPRWEDRVYDLNGLEGVDLFFSYWTGPSIAHVIVSFPFANQPPLAFSIEIRRERGEDYSPIAGFFKQYELAIIAADERDVVRLRTDIWKEDVRLYRLSVSRTNARRLLEGYVREVNALSVEPRWYDTLGGNCTTIAYRLAQTIWPDLKLDWRVIASGYGPDFAYDLGAVDTSIPLAELKQRARGTEKGQAAGDTEGYSAALRAGVPLPPR